MAQGFLYTEAEGLDKGTWRPPLALEVSFTSRSYRCPRTTFSETARECRLPTAPLLGCLSGTEIRDLCPPGPHTPMHVPKM